MIQPVLLWTDQLVFVLLACLFFFVLYARKRPHLRAPWQAVLTRPMGVVTLMILSVFLIIALLDSLHFRLPVKPVTEGQQVNYSVDVLSLLDVVLGPVKRHTEKSYSSPFATRLFVQESIIDAAGHKQRVNKRLQYGGAHLEDENRREEDILLRTGSGLISGTLLWVATMAGLFFFRGRRKKVSQGNQKDSGLPVRGTWVWAPAPLTLLFILLVVSVCVQLAPYYHIFGTDKVGQDVFYAALKSVRTALLIGTLTTLIMLPFAIMMGIMAGYIRGRVDDAIQYVYTTLNSIPGVLLIASAVLLLQVYIESHPEVFDTDAARADMRLLFLCIILGVTSWTGLCRLIRGEVLKLSALSYVEAAEAFGVRPFRVMLQHFLPNVMHIVLITVVLDFSGLVLAEAVLSYVGVGVDPNMFSWGNMINGARLEMAREPMVWWGLTAAFVLMFTLVLAANLFADVVRDVFDPKKGHL